MSVLDELYRRFEIALENGDEETADTLAFAIKEREGSPVPVEEEESGVIENLLTGFGAGAVNVGEMATLGAAALLEEEDETKARKAIQDTFDIITPEGGDKDSFSYKIGQGFGSVAGIAAPAAAAVFGGAPTLAATGIAGLLGVGAAAGEASERARAAGATEEERSAATLRGAPIGLLEILPLGRFIKAIDVPVITKLANNIGPETVETMGQRIHSAALSGGFEAAQEATSGILQNLNEQEYNALAETFGGVGEEATIGGIVGATLDLFLPGGSRMANRGKLGDPRVGEQVEEDLNDEVPPEERAMPEFRGQDPQGELFPDELDEAETEALRQMEEAEVGPRQPEATPEETPATTDERQIDLLEDAEETAQVQAMVDEDERQEKAKVEERQKLQQESDLAETEGRKERRQQVESEEGRRAVLLDVVENNPTNNYNTLQGKFESALSEAGYTDTTTKDSERSTIERAVNVQRAQEEAIPADSDLAPLESQIRERGAPRQPAPNTTPELKRQELPELPPAAQKALADKGIEVPKQKVQPAPVVEEAKVQPAPKKVQPAPVVEEAKVQPAPKKVQPAPKTKVAPQPVATTTPTKPIPGMSTVDPETGKLVVDTPIKLADTDRTALAPVSDVTQYVDEKGKDKEFRKKRPAESVPRYEDAKDKFNADRVIAKYFNAYANPESALRAAAFEVANDMPAVRNVKGAVDPVEVKRRGTGGKSAKAVVEWAKNNLPTETNAAIDKQIETDKAEDAKAVENTKKKLREEVAAAELAKANAKQKKKQAKMELEGGKALAAKERVARRKRKEAAAQRAKKQAETKDAKKADTATKKGKVEEAEPLTVEQIKEIIRKEAATKPVEVNPTVKSKKQEAEEIRAQVEDFVAKGGSILQVPKLDTKDRRALETPLSAAVQSKLIAGDVKGALETLASEATSPRVKNVAKALADNLGPTKVFILPSDALVQAFPEQTNKTLGLYVTAEDAIYLQAERGLTVDTLLHEVTHAATIFELNIKDGKPRGTTPNAKRLVKMYEAVKAEMEGRGIPLNTYYGMANVGEFVAEAFGNPEFQHILDQIQVDGKFDRPMRAQIAGFEGKRVLSYWNQFVHTITDMVRRFMGLDPSPTMLDKVDAVVYDMLIPSDAGQRSLFAGEFGPINGTAESAARVMEDLGDIQKKFKDLTGSKESFIDNAVDLLGDVPANAKKFILNVVGSQGVGDVARKQGFGDLGIRLHKMLNLRRGAMDKADAEMRAVTEKLSKFAAADEKNQPQLDKVIYDPVIGATITQLDPTLTEAEATKRYKNSDDLATWKKQQVEWKKLGKEGQDMYVELRDAYKNQFLKLKDSIFNRLDNAVSDESMSKEAANTLKQQVLEQMFSNTTLDVYFPLTREGDFVLSYAFDNPKNPEQAYVVRRFTTKREMERVKAELEKDSEIVTDSIEAKRDLGKATMYDNAPPATFAGKTLKLLKEGNASEELQDAFMTMYMDHLPETSFAQSLRRRSGVLGFEGNSKTAIRTKGFDLARQAVQIEYSGRISGIRSEINNVERPKDVDEKVFADLQAHMDATANFAINGAKKKGMEKFVKNANQVAFIYTIGFNVSSALVNLSQIPLVVLPYLSSRHGLGASTQAITNASQIVGGTSDRYAGTGIDDLFDLDANGNYTAKDSLSDGQKKMIKDMNLEVLVKAAAEQGQLTKAFLPDALAVHEQGRAARGGIMGSALDVVSNIGAHFGFAQAERFNRQTAMVATYDLSLKQLRAKKKAGEKYYASTKAEFVDLSTMSDSDITALAAEEAIYQVQETNGGAVLETSPKWAQQGIGRIAFMYKTYGLQMYYTMFKSAKLFTDNIGDNTPEGIELRRQAKKQIAGVYLSSALMAGVQGVPLYGLVRAIADMFLDEEEDDADTIVRKYIGEGFYKGPLVEALGVDFATRIKLTDLVIQTNRYNNDPSTEEVIGFHLGGPALSVGNRFIRGIGDLRKGETERGVESILPAALSNAYKSTFGRFARDEGIYTRRGDPIYDDMSFKDLAFQTMGFAPAEYTFAQEQASMSKRIESGVMSKRQELLKNLNIARRFGDVEEAKDILKDIKKFNKRHRRQAINGETIRRSASQFSRTTATMHNGVTITKSLRADAARSRDEYQKGYEVLFGKEE
jgi:hypothetical protein